MKIEFNQRWQAEFVRCIINILFFLLIAFAFFCALEKYTEFGKSLQREQWVGLGLGTLSDHNSKRSTVSEVDTTIHPKGSDLSEPFCLL